MHNEGYLFAAFAVVWAGVFVFTLFLFARQARLHREIEALKQAAREKDVK